MQGHKSFEQGLAKTCYFAGVVELYAITSRHLLYYAALVAAELRQLASYAAGLFSWYVLDRRGGGLILSAVFAVIIVWLIRRYRESSWGRPGPPGPGRV